MSKYEVWAKDPYGRNEILTILSAKGRPENEFKTPHEAFEAAKRYVHDKNRNNPLTYDTQRANPKCVLPVLAQPEETSLYYAGNLIHGKHKMIVASAGNSKIEEVPLQEDAQFKFYLGLDPDNKVWYLQDPRRRDVNTLDASYVTERVLLYIHKQ